MCVWTLEEDDSDLWETSCEKAFILNEGTPHECEMFFCCYCGQPLEEGSPSRGK